MKNEITYLQLHQLHQDIQLQAAKSPAFAFFNKERIKRFYEKASLRLQTIDERRQSLIRAYVQHDADNEPMTKEDENGVKLYVFESEEKEKQYLEDTEKFMNRTLPLVL